MSDYSPVETLRAEVERFFATNEFNAMQVTNFYAQARCVLNYLDELETEAREFLDHATRLDSNAKSMRQLMRRH